MLNDDKVAFLLEELLLVEETGSEVVAEAAAFHRRLASTTP